MNIPNNWLKIQNFFSEIEKEVLFCWEIQFKPGLNGVDSCLPREEIAASCRLAVQI